MPFQQFKYQLKEACSGPLPGEYSHRKMALPKRELPVAPGEAPIVRRSSVLALIFPEGDELYTCLIKRPYTMKHHAGQIALPGGQIDETDTDEIVAALREANEEIGVDSNTVEVIGHLSGLYVSISRFSIYPVIGWSDSKPRFSINPDEVEELILFPLLQHTNNSLTSETEVDTLSGKLKTPCIIFQEKVIWGATAMILSELFDVMNTLPFIRELKSNGRGNA
ncbi:Hypothetical nudix hydrolase YeaB [hydrothermal vent metagenome]|uniref:Hypothetical nudix hydrolase YeaB n=1 Tax=hydrothermal vent metagenome TaxID=652676 RepID=A0A3B0U003_9ZZZZ